LFYFNSCKLRHKFWRSIEGQGIYNVQELIKNTQKNISGGDAAFFGVRCVTDLDCCDPTRESLFYVASVYMVFVSLLVFN